MSLYDKENYFTFVHKIGEDSYEVFYPKTVAQQVITGKNTTFADHLASTAHLTSGMRDMLSKAGQANGIAKLDVNGKLPLSTFHESFVLIKVQFDDIDQMLADTETRPGSMCFVLDASADPTVTNGGWAVYRRTNDPDHSTLDVGWIKVFENESIDVKVDWQVIQRSVGINASAEEIDQMVEDAHTHNNKSVIDGLDVDENGNLTYNNKAIAYMNDVTKYFWEDYIDKTAMRVGDIWMQGSICQPWWSDPSVEYAGTSCYEKYMDQDTLESAPKLRTKDVTTARRMFYRCYGLKDVPQYDWNNLLDGMSMFEEASSLETVPYMNTNNIESAERMFYGTTSLRYSPEMKLNTATSMKEMFMGDMNLVEVYPFGSTANVTDMTRAFSGCDALEKIDSAIDFSSIESSVFVNDMFKDNIELRELNFEPNTLNVSLSLEDTNLSTTSLVNVFNGLAEYTGERANAPVLNVRGVEDVGNLSGTEKAIVYNKGWKLLEDDEPETVTDPSQVADVIANVGAGETVIVEVPVDTTNGKALNISTDDVSLVLTKTLTCDGSNTSGIRVTNGSVEISGTGIITTTTPYDRNHASGVVGITTGGEVTFNGGGVSAVVADDPVNKGQFGITVYGDGKLTVNDGEFKAGWYCISGNGSQTNMNSVTEINGGTFTSVADYAIYHPHAGSLIINDGYISGAAGAIAANNGYIEINGGTIAVLGGGDTGDSSDGTGGLGNAAINLNARYGDIVCRIYGGTFIADDDNIMIATGTAHNVDLQIFGGRFTSKPDASWLAEGCTCTDTPDAEGYYVVTQD